MVFSLVSTLQPCDSLQIHPSRTSPPNGIFTGSGNMRWTNLYTHVQICPCKFVQRSQKCDGNIQNPIATARFRCPETGTVCKFVHRSQKRDGNYSKSYCYGAISDDQNSAVQICPKWSRFKSEILIVTGISTSSKQGGHTHERTDSFSGVVRI